MRCVWPSCLNTRFGALAVCHWHADICWQSIQAERDANIQPVDASPKRPAAKPHERHGWLYYLDVNGRLKIGFATNVENRLRSYPPGTVELGRRRGTMADERDEHRRCKPWRVAGREWYELNDSTRRVIDEAVAAERRRVAEELAATPLPPRPGYAA